MCIEMQLLAKNAKQEKKKKPYYLNKINFDFYFLFLFYRILLPIVFFD